MGVEFTRGGVRALVSVGISAGVDATESHLMP